MALRQLRGSQEIHIHNIGIINISAIRGECIHLGIAKDLPIARERVSERYTFEWLPLLLLRRRTQFNLIKFSTAEGSQLYNYFRGAIAASQSCNY